MRELKNCTKVVNSHNEWDPLEEVIVGNPSNAWASFWDPIDKYIFSKEDDLEVEKHLKLYKPYPKEYIEAAKSAMSRLVNILEGEGVVVRHAYECDYSGEFSNTYWKTPSGFCAANPRDPFLIIGDKIIEAPMCSRSRYFEARAYRDIFKEYAKSGAKWVSAPKPILDDNLYNPKYELKNSPTKYVLTEAEPVFDAADFIRCGRDIIGQCSHVTNSSGIDWLRNFLGEEYTIHLIESLDPKPSHIDTTLALLSPGKVLVNPNFVDVNKLPPFLKKWDKLIAPNPIPFNVKPKLMSDWISINTLMLDRERIIVEKRQKPLIKALKDWGFKPIVCDFEDYYRFIGGFHCATLDVRRRGELESYS